jgi:hypothetical protein
MRKIKLTKLNTLEEAVYPQKEKYPDNWYVEGYSSKKPEVGEVFYVLENKLYPIFRTSTLTKVINKKSYIIFTTLNSTYKLEYIS